MRSREDVTLQRTSSERRPTAIARAVVTTYGARLATLVAYVALLPIVMGAFGSEAYGVYVLTVALGALFQQDLGIGDATTRFIAVALPSGDVARMRRIASASVAFYLVAAVVMAGATACAYAVTLPRTTMAAALVPTAWTLAAIGVANVLFLLLLSPQRQILAGVGRIDTVNYLLIGQAALRVVATIAVCVAHLGIVAVGIVDLVATLAFGIAAVIMRRRQAPHVTPSLRLFEWRVFRELFSMSAQLMVLGIASVVIMQAGGILTALLLPIAYTALYAAGQRIYTVVKEVTNSLSTAILPSASIRQGEGTPNGDLYLRGTSYANMLMTLVLVPSLIFMPQVMEAWLPSGGAQAAVVAQLLILSMLANNNHLLAVPILTAQGSVRGYAALHVVWALTGTALASALGGPFGLAGIAAGLAIPVLILEPAYIAIALRRLKLRLRDFVMKCLVAPFATVAPIAVLLAVVAAWLEPGLWGAVWLSAAWLAAALAVYCFVGLDADDRIRVRAMLLRRGSRHTRKEVR